MEKVLRVEDGKYVTGDVIGAEVELMKLLWENPSPSAEFAAQTISVDLSEYDFIEISTYEGTPIYKARVGEGVNIQIHNRVTASGKLQYIIRNFNVTRTSGIIISDATVYTDSATAGTVVNGRIVPTKIYGIKNKIQTIAKDVATTADKCIMSDGVTSVEDEITSISDKVYGRDYVEVTGNGSKNWTQLLNELFSLVDLNKVTCNSVFTMDFISYFHLAVDTGSALRFSYVEVGPSAVYILTTHLTESSSYYKYATNTSVTDKSAEVISNGMKLAVIY